MPHPSLFFDIHQFHEKFGLKPVEKVGELNAEVLKFRIDFMREELNEFERAAAFGDLEGELDALVDLVYVALGTAYLAKFPFGQAWNRVQKANMAKVRAEKESDSKRGSVLDVVKPEGWTPPSHHDLVKPDDHHIQDKLFWKDVTA